jgi:hypothetical protein
MPLLKEHLDNTLKFNNDPTPVPRMILCSVCTTLPLVLGYFQHQLPIAIFGALFGFVLILNDHFGPLKQRIMHLFVTFIMLTLSFYVEAILFDKIALIAVTLFLVSFLVGKSKNYGIELERMLLFMALQILTAAGLPGLMNHFWSLIAYCSFAFVNYIVCLTLVFLYSKHPIEFMESKRKTLNKIISQKHTTRFAFIFSCTTTLGYLLANWMHIGRGYWVVGTTLIVMLPNSYQSFYKSIQRLLGTFIGVVIAAFLINLGHDPITLTLFVLVSALFAPLGLLRNYWLGNIFIAALILFLLELSTFNQIYNHTQSFDLARLRTIDIALGCLLGIIGSLINDPSIILDTKRRNLPLK